MDAPVSLGKYITSVGVVGFPIELDNMLGIIIQPLLRCRSDNLRMRGGHLGMGPRLVS